MKKKSLFSIALSLGMVLTMVTPTFAANTNTNVNADGTDVTAPGHPDYTAGNIQAGGESYNESVMTSTNGTNWETVNDDDKLAGTADTNGADINVWAKATDAKTKTYKVDFAWGPMKFEYDSVGSTTWNPETHKYDTTATTPTWKVAYLDGTNNKVAITNHSNNGIDAKFAYAMDTATKFNDANGLNNVIGNFFDTNAKAATAAKVLTNTYSNTTGTVNDAAVADKLAGNKVALATAAAYNDGTNDQVAGPRNKDVFFAFSGTPDDGKGAATLKDFAKVGVINVTVTPNNDATLN